MVTISKKKEARCEQTTTAPTITLLQFVVNFTKATLCLRLKLTKFLSNEICLVFE